jgi:anti-sigma B factor antagonist
MVHDDTLARLQKRLPHTLTVQVCREGATVFVQVAGELDLAAEEPLGELLDALSAQDGVKCLIADFRPVTFLDSSGLRLLLKIEMQSRGDDFDFALIPPHGPAAQALKISGVDKLIKMRESDGARAAERASAGLGTPKDDPGEWFSSEPLQPSGRERRKDFADEIF